MALIHRISKNYEFSLSVVEMARILLRINYSTLLWLWLGVFFFENHEGKPRIF